MEPIKHVVDATAAVTIVSSFLNVLPVVISCIAGVLSIAWYIVRFYDRAKAKKGTPTSVIEEG